MTEHTKRPAEEEVHSFEDWTYSYDAAGWTYIFDDKDRHIDSFFCKLTEREIEMYRKGYRLGMENGEILGKVIKGQEIIDILKL